jgi:hypothetical protein
MKNIEDYTKDDAFRGVRSFRVVQKEGKVELEEVDTFYLMAQEELGGKVFGPLPEYWQEPLHEPEEFCMKAEEKHAIYASARVLQPIENTVRAAYSRLEAGRSRIKEAYNRSTAGSLTPAPESVPPM